MLLTAVLGESNTDSTYIIQQRVLRTINNESDCRSIEVVLSTGEVHEFSSYEECYKETCKRRMVEDYNTGFYLIILDKYNISEFDDIVLTISDLVTSNPSANVLVYVDNVDDYLVTAKEVLDRLIYYLFPYCALLLPGTDGDFYLVKRNLSSVGPAHCGSNEQLYITDECVGGKMMDIEKDYFDTGLGSNFHNCTLGVIAKEYQPFVINENEGFEIELLGIIGKRLNIHFNITVSNSSEWGKEVTDNDYTGDLEAMYEHMYLGIGNIDTGMGYEDDFVFSTSYHMEARSWVVPKARLVPKWRSFIAMFNLKIWGICLGSIFFYALMFYLTAKLSETVTAYKKLDTALEASFKVILSTSETQPKSDLTRMFFISLAVFGIILYSIYTVYLLKYLKNPIREHQYRRNFEIYDSSGNLRVGVGGIKRLKSLFNISEPQVRKIYDAYQVADSGKHDTVLYWFKKVADERNIWTISNKLYSEYLLAHTKAVLNPDGSPKVFIFREKLMTYSVSILARQGHPLIFMINRIIGQLMQGAIVQHLVDNQTSLIEIRKAKNNKEGVAQFSALSIDHLQGAFALLIVGCSIAFVSFIIELVVDEIAIVRLRKRFGYIP
nr:unnamed protein product [Callosobruchus analis]